MSGAYYNEIDPYAAQWLRNLIGAGLIAPGEVDERSIEDVTPDDLRGFTQCHFFAGIGVWSYALRRAGWSDDRPIWTGSCPCQPFSAAGKRGGTADERHLWPAFFHLIEAGRPAVVLGEQVASKDGLAWLDTVQADLEASGYAVGATDLCAAGVGAPHIRQRLWFVGVADADGGRQCEREERDSYAPQPEQQAPCGNDIGGRNRLGDLALAAGERRIGRGASEAGDEPGALERPERLCDVGGLEHEQSDGRIERGTEPVGRSATSGCGDGGLAYSDGGDASAERLQRGGQHGQQPQDGGAVGGLPNASDARPPCAGRDSQPEGPFLELGDDGGEDRSARPGPTNGIWRNADWLLCRDGKWRPVESGTFPLVNGAPARVGRLRAYGNAIVAEAAREFIEAVDWSTGGDLA